MPIYEYKCTYCAYELEVLQNRSEDPLKTCTECQRDALVKKISFTSFRLKGQGWYETDFKSSNSQKQENKNSSSNTNE